MQLFPRPDLPFDREDANRYLPWVIAVMTALTGFLMAIGIVLGGLVQDNQKDLAYRMQVQLPYDEGNERPAAEKLVEKLRSFSSVAEASLVSETNAKELLSPWLGTSKGIAGLPLPAIIDVKLRAESVDKGEMTPERMRTMLGDAWPGMVIDGYEKWIADFNQLTKSVQFTLYSIAGLVLISAIVIVLLITRASVQLHFPIVRLLHRIGARDDYISRQFQINAITMTLKGGIPGIVVAAGLFIASHQLLGHIPSLSLQDIHLPFSLVVMMMCIPISMVACVSLAVQMTVRQMLLKLH